MSEFNEPLSPAGERRREQILRVALATARGRRMNRRALRAGGVCAVLFVCAWVAIHRAPSNPGAPARQQIAIVPGPPAHSMFVVEQIKTDPGIVDRLSVHPTPAWTTIGDDDLLQTLADAGEPAGLIIADGQTMLMQNAAPEQVTEQ